MKTDDPIFTDLALKVIAGKATEAEQAQLKLWLAQPCLAEEFKQLKADAAFAKEVLPLIGSEKVGAGPVPGYAKSQLRNLMNQQANAEERKTVKPVRSWGWVLGLASAAAVIVVVVMLNPPTQHTTVQFAMLDSMGQMRGGTNDVTASLMGDLRESFGETNLSTFSGDQELNQWLKQWPAATTVKIVYDRDASEVRVIYAPKNGQLVTKTFPVTKESDLPAVLKKAADSLK
jgi:hypothetical protein